MGLLGDGLPVVVMLFLNAVAAVMVSLVKVAMDGGMNPLVLVTLQQLTASIFLTPIAYFKERAALRQYMIFVGLRYTTATFVTAFSNIAPVLTFLLAVATRSEALNLKSKTGMAKLVGTLVSLGGAMVLTLYKGVTPHPRRAAASAAAASGGGARRLITRQVDAGHAGHPRELRLPLLLVPAPRPPRQKVAAVGLCTQRTISPWIISSKFQILTVLYAGIVGCGISFRAANMVHREEGAVFVAAFIPVVQIIVSVIDFCILHEQLYLGSVLGSVLVIGGLYLLLWGKRQEALHCPPKDAEDDKEQQLPVQN
ncbi:hypothetical protein PR202_ga18391 [Eleusine coracana subsp. coracana]|uniref:WAT1-related protein n=1 Tax=Eleusine coracana subsp. coracana TaxID=191504 RepID=A0AAV5CSE1_ELECO|nr:hypothetical protein PR202_ga18391 [Eleusine coracana subsp. coracana]